MSLSPRHSTLSYSLIKYDVHTRRVAVSMSASASAGGLDVLPLPQNVEVDTQVRVIQAIP